MVGRRGGGEGGDNTSFEDEGVRGMKKAYEVGRVWWKLLEDSATDNESDKEEEAKAMWREDLWEIKQI